MRSVALNWERAVLGTALYDPSSMDDASDLNPSDFTSGHQMIWAELMSLNRMNNVDMRALIERLRTHDQLDEIDPSGEADGEDYLRYLLTYRGSAMSEYALHVLDDSIKRELRSVAALIAVDAEAESISGEDALDEAEERLMRLRRSRSIDLGTPMSEIVAVFNSRLDAMRAGTLRPAWVPKISPIREIISFVDKDDFVIVAARPGEGKSSLMRYEFVKQGLEGTPVLLFNLENNELEYAKFATSLLTGIDGARLRNPRLLDDDEIHKVREAANELASAPIYVKTIGAPSVGEIKRICMQHIKRHDIKLIGVDYTQLIRNGMSRKVDDVSETSAVLRSIALNYGVPVVAASQLSRLIEHRGVNAPPTLSDLRESGSLEQDATQVWFQRWHWAEPTPTQINMFPQNIDPRGVPYMVPKALPVRTFVEKNRNGPTGVTPPYLWVMATNDFLPLSRLEDM